MSMLAFDASILLYPVTFGKLLLTVLIMACPSLRKIWMQHDLVSRRDFKSKTDSPLRRGSSNSKKLPKEVSKNYNTLFFTFSFLTNIRKNINWYFHWFDNLRYLLMLTQVLEIWLTFSKVGSRVYLILPKSTSYSSIIFQTSSLSCKIEYISLDILS